MATITLKSGAKVSSVLRIVPAESDLSMRFSVYVDATDRVSRTTPNVILVSPNGILIDLLTILHSFGLWKVDKTTGSETVYQAIKAGYRLFDSAGDYGNEKQSGAGLKRAFDEGLVKREDVCTRPSTF